MRIRTTLPILCASLALTACRNKEETAAALASQALENCRNDLQTAQNDTQVCRRQMEIMRDEHEPPPVPIEADDAPAAEAPEFEVKVGSTYMLGQGNQTIVMNPKPVDDGLRRFAKGAVCRFDANGTVKIVAKHQPVSDDGDTELEYLVRYTRDPAPEALKDGALEYPDSEPYECPTGTVYFLDDASILEELEPDSRFEDARKLLDSEKH